MSIADLHRKAGTAGEAPAFACCDYTALPGSARCRHYQAGGTCAHPDRFLCEEWERRNADRLRNPRGSSRASAEVDPSGKPKPPDVPKDLFGNPLPEPTAKDEPRPRLQPLPAQREADGSPALPPLRGLTTEDIESFRRLGVELCLQSEAAGELWIVPHYTGKDRLEITPENVATLWCVMETFPGAKVVSFSNVATKESRK